LVYCFAIGVALTAVHTVHPEGLVDDLTYLGVTLGAAALAWWGAARSGFDRLATYLALGITLSGLADLIYQFFWWFDQSEPDISIADIGWLGSYVAIGAALFQMLRGTKGLRSDLDGLIDVAAVAILATVVQWELFVGDLVADTSVPVLPRVVWCLYPILDAILLALVLRAVVTQRMQDRTAKLVAAGAFAWLFADTLYSVLVWTPTWSIWLDAGWLLGALLLAAGACSVPRGRTIVPTTALANRPGRLRLAIALLPLLVPPVFEIVGFARGQDPNPVPLFVASGLLLVVAYARVLRTQQGEYAARDELRSQAHYAQALAMNASDAVAVLDAEGRVLNDEASLGAMVGRDGVSPVGADAFSLVAAADLEVARSTFDRALASPGTTFESELRVDHLRDGERWLSVRFVNLLDDPDVGGVVVNLHDITDRKEAEANLTHEAFHDRLTGLANRALFTDRVQQALARGRRSREETAVIFLDLDSFKTVNDSLGHAAGDELLQEVGRRLLGAVRAGDTVARLGGDEFAILIEQSRRAVDEAEGIADRILSSLTMPVTAGGVLVAVSASLGIAVAEDQADASSLLRDADVAMYRAKSTGKGRWVVYDTGMRRAAVERLQLESELSLALRDEQLRILYQPVVDLATSQVMGFEALLRWNHPELGTLAPDRFIPVAEDNGLIIPIGRWVLREACQTAVRWNRDLRGGEPLTMAVNVSARQLAYGDLAGDVKAALTASGLDPRLLVLELTESSLVQDVDLAAKRLRELRELGVRVAVDDFGTGYSSLSYLRQFPVDVLKIDRSFVKTITDGAEVPAIVRGLLDLGRTLGLELVAEGVEERVQRDSLRDAHCDLAQGFLFARPLEPADAEALLLNPARQRT
jgi:diguanylate cyclase (GGDEF)-like protein/PAS domain S-box-containing protein